MSSYIYLFILISLCSFISLLQTDKKINLSCYFFCTIALILFAGLRNSGVGDDDANYVQKFHEIPDISHWIWGSYKYTFADAWMEPGYIFIGALIKFFSTEYIFLFLTIALFSVGIASYNYYRYTKYALFAILLFYVHTYLYRDINQIRSAVAAAIGLFLIYSIHHKQYIKSLFIIFLASTFHMAAFSYVVVVLLSFLSIGRKTMAISVVISIFVGAVGISYLLLSMLPGMGYITEKLLDYADSGYAESVKLFDITNIKNLVIFFACILFWDRLSEKVPFFKTLMLFYFIAVSWRILFNDFGIFAARISTFFAVVEVLLIPSFFYIFKNKIFISIVIISYAFLTLYINLFLKEGRFPYTINSLFSL